MIKLENAHKSFKNSKEPLTVIDGVDFELMPNQSIGIMGKSGCGKSTLAKVIMRSLDLDSGKLIFGGEDITNFKGKNLRKYRKTIQLISQRPESFFDPSMKIIKSLKEPLQNFKIYDKQRFEQDLDFKLDEFKLQKSQLNRYPHQLSGGEIQRFSILRAILLKPKALILDECTSMLDISVQAQILHLLKKLREKENLSFIVISHDKYIVDFICDFTFEMKDGKLYRQSK